jgi:hypothetical protein
MKKMLFSVVVLALVLSACAVSDYPIITDDRGSYSGVIRTGHKAYIIPTSSVATSYPDGSDELFSLVFQNQYGDQKIYTFNNFDPTDSVQLLDQTYCDWRYEGCEIAQAWNPANALIDDPLDYQFFADCSGARSLSMLATFSSRVGECGDGAFMAHKQALATEFANLASSTWRGRNAYIVPLDGSNLSLTLSTAGVSQTVPIYGTFNGFITEDLNLILPMTPNARQQLAWIADFATQYGQVTQASVTYGSLSADVKIRLVTEGLQYNRARF